MSCKHILVLYCLGEFLLIKQQRKSACLDRGRTLYKIYKFPCVGKILLLQSSRLDKIRNGTSDLRAGRRVCFPFYYRIPLFQPEGLLYENSSPQKEILDVPDYRELMLISLCQRLRTYRPLSMASLEKTHSKWDI